MHQQTFSRQKALGHNVILIQLQLHAAAAFPKQTGKVSCHDFGEKYRLTFKYFSFHLPLVLIPIQLRYLESFLAI